MWNRMRTVKWAAVAVLAGGMAVWGQGGGEAASQPAATGVVAENAPVVVKTVPEAGKVDVDPKLTEIRVTFSKDMVDGNWSFVQTAVETFPKTTGRARFLEDKRTCVLPVALEAGKGYVIWINRAPYNSFMDLSHNRAVPYMLVFETKK